MIGLVLSSPSILLASLGLLAPSGLSVMVVVCDLVFMFPVLFLCRELATDPKKLRKIKSVKMIADGIRSWFGRVITFLPDRRCFIRVSGRVSAICWREDKWTGVEEPESKRTT